MTKLEDVIYSAILLSKSSQTMLINYLKSIFFGPSYKVFCEHLTLAFGPDVTADHIRNIGVAVKSLVPDKILIGTNGQIGLFFNPHQLDIRGIPFVGKYPHITLATPEGIPPSETGMLPEREHFHFTVGHEMPVEGVISAFMTDGSWKS